MNPVQSSSDDIPEYHNHPSITSAVHNALFWNFNLMRFFGEEGNPNGIPQSLALQIV